MNNSLLILELPILWAYFPNVARLALGLLCFLTPPTQIPLYKIRPIPDIS